MAWRSLFIFGLSCLLLTAAARSAHAFSVAPAIIDLAAARGASTEGTVTVVNDSATSRTFYLRTLAFAASDETGAPTFLPADEEQTGLPAWIRFEETSVEVDAGSALEVPFLVGVPSDAGAGTHQAAIVVSDAPYEVVATNGASISAKIAVLVFLDIAGENTERAELLDFSVSFPDLNLAFGGAGYRIQNQGNVQIRPEGTITLRNVFGQTIAVADANPDAGRILPGTTRSFTTLIGQPAEEFWSKLQIQARTMAIGPVTATLELTWGTGQRMSAEAHATVWPIELLFTLAVALTLAISGSVLYINRLKKK